MRYRHPLKEILEKTRWYWDHNDFSPAVRAAFRNALLCRTPALGAEVFGSEIGELVVYHTCKSRACTSCGHWATMKWQHERLIALPARYKGITFTMPDVLWSLFRDNRPLADALPALAANAIKAFTTARHGINAGVIAILHTFNGKLEFNSHVHTMVTAGGWRASSGSWARSVFYDQSVLTRLWRKSVLDLLRASLRSGALKTDMASQEVEAMLKEQERWWSVKIQSFNSTEHFLEYAGRYARRPPIAQRRISYIGERMVEFWAKDKMSGKFVRIRCSLEDFIDRWAQHIARRYKHAARYFGLFAPRAVSQTFNAIFAALGHKRQTQAAPLPWSDSIKMTFGWDPLVDQRGQRLYWVRRVAPQASA